VEQGIGSLSSFSFNSVPPPPPGLRPDKMTVRRRHNTSRVDTATKSVDNVVAPPDLPPPSLGTHKPGLPIIFTDDPHATLPERFASLGMLRLQQLRTMLQKEPITCAKGQIICRAGTKSDTDGCYILVRGRVEVVSSSKTREQLAILRPVSIFGHFSTFLGIARLNSVVALDDAVAYFVLSKIDMDTLNVQWNGALYACMDLERSGLVHKVVWKTKRFDRQIHSQFFDTGLVSCEKIRKPRRKTVVASTEAEEDEDEGIRLHSGRAFGALPPPPTLQIVRTEEMNELAKRAVGKSNMPYLLAMSRTKLNNKRRSGRALRKGDRALPFELKARNTRAGTDFQTFQGKRQDEIYEQIDEVRRSARRVAKGRELYMAAMAGTQKFYVKDKTGLRNIPFRLTVQRIDPMGVDTDV